MKMFKKQQKKVLFHIYLESKRQGHFFFFFLLQLCWTGHDMRLKAKKKKKQVQDAVLISFFFSLSILLHVEYAEYIH